MANRVEERKFPKAGSRESRAVTIQKSSIDGEKRTVDLAFSSEQPVVRWWGIEILSHDPGAMDMSRMQNGGAVLLNHSTDKQIGVVEDCRCDQDKVGRATVRFSRSTLGEEVFRDVADGIRRNVSVGYSIDEDPIQMSPEEMSDEIKNLALKEQAPAYRIRRWTPYEVSMVPIPADTSVGVGRSKESALEPKGPVEIPAHVAKEVQLMPDKTAEELAAQQRAKEQKEQENRDAIQKAERERIAEITALVSRHNLPAEMRDKAISDGLSIEQFRHNVLKHIGTTKPIDTPPSDLGMSEGDRKRYSIGRAIAAAINGDWSQAGFERECSMAIEKRISKEGYNKRGTFFVPYDVPLRTEQRTVLTAGGSTTGASLVGTTLRPDLFIELLRNRMIATKLGIQMLSGLVGNIAIPSFTAAATAYWVAENTAPTAGNQTFGQVTLSPKTVGAYTDFSRQLLLQGTPAVDGLVQGDLSKILALAIDLALFHGTGANGQPLGIAGVSGIGSEAGASFAWGNAVNMETLVAAANADVAGMRYVANATIRGLLKGRPKIGTTYPVFMIEDNQLNGYPVEVTNQIAAGDMFFGDFTQVMMGEWGVLDILVDPYTGSSAGTVRIVAFQSVDVAVRHPVAFTLATSIT
jgi:HK97 family phage major capsid protein